MTPLHYHASLPLLHLEAAYRRRYAGSESDPRFQPRQDIEIDVRIDLPHMLTISDDTKSAIAARINRAIKDMMYDVAKIAADETAP